MNKNNKSISIQELFPTLTDEDIIEDIFDDIINEAYENMNNHCYGCLYSEYDSNQIPCNTCLNWVDGYLTATNYKNKFE